MTEQRMRLIANSWHGGQWTALYSFASTGTIDADAIRKECRHTMAVDGEVYSDLLDLMDYVGEYERGLLAD